MENSKVLEILKTAILLERRGKAFYSGVAAKTDNADVKEFFLLMAREEDEHIKFLTEQFSRYTSDKQFNKISAMHGDDDTASLILSGKLKQQIGAASFEAAAVASAIDMENRAIAVYKERAETATDPTEKEFYRWLATWESGHHKILLDIDMALKEKIWNDNQFWPF